MKKIILISLALVMALGGLGATYAMWSDTVTIDGTVETGQVLIGFQELSAFEDDEYLGKDVGSFTRRLVDQVGVHWDEASQSFKPIFDKIIVTIENGYPCYTVHFIYTVANGGTIPVHIISFDLVDPTGELNFVWTTPPPNTPAVGWFWKDFNNDGIRQPVVEDIMSAKLVNLVSTQLEPCDEDKAELDIHILQPAEQDHTYYFEATILAQQWAD